MIRAPTEHEEQKAVIEWRDNVAVLKHRRHCMPDGRFPLIAIPNGGLRNVIVARKLKAEGVTAGVPDLFLPIPRTPYHGLWIEMKRRKGGRVSPDQAAVIAGLRAKGYHVVIARGSDEAIAAIEEYLS